MRVLQIHNKYQHMGGEDSLLNAEYELLKKYGHEVEQLFFDNKKISNSTASKLFTGISSIYNGSSEKTVEEKINELKPDLIHVHNFFPLLSPAVFYVANRKKIPIVLTIHNYRLLCANALLFRDGHICEECVSKLMPLNGIIHKCYRKSAAQSAAVTMMSSFHKIKGTWKEKIDKYIMLTEFSKDKFIHSSLKLPPEKIAVKPNFVADIGYGNDIRDDFYIFLGRLSEEKGISTLLESAEFYKYKLKIIGDGPFKDLVLKYAAANPNIEYVGFKDKNYIAGELKKARAVIFPSNCYEGLSITIVEALSSGTPVIISDLPSLKELITDNYNGIYFANGNPQDLALKIKYLDDAIEKMGHLYTNARKTYLEKYTPEMNYTKLKDIYTSVIENYGKKRSN